MLKIKQYPRDKSIEMLDKILDQIYNVWTSEKLFTQKSNDIKTKEIKTALINLGHYNNKRVYANRLKGYVGKILDYLEKIENKKKEDKSFVETEWLYDVHWYTDVDDKPSVTGVNEENKEFYMPETFDLACEIEWYKIRNTSESKSERLMKKDGEKEYYLSGLKYDFQKLLVSNANINLFITNLVDEKKEIKPFLEYCRKAINCYTQRSSNSKFLVVCFLKDELFYLEQ